ncbi:tetratricopeptide repeat protein [Sphaerisporangium sp. NPDC005289]|uniref:tetratricopeptide repeat protein n=1 Tax=Sphaerisporangium sp. NPDC005289 TaxID=3155247 RepID=UPI0033AF022F
MSAQERRLSAIGEAAAGVLRTTAYHLVRAEDVAAAVRLSREGHSGRRSAVWLYNEVKSRRVLVALALDHAFAEFAERNGPQEPPSVPASLVEARDQVTQALLLVARFHRAESFLTQQVQLGIGDIATSEKRQSAPQEPPSWPGSAIGRVASAGWAGRVLAYARHLAPVLAAAAQAVCPPPPGWAESCAEKLSDLAFDALTDDPDGPVDRQAAALGAHWYERHLVPLAGSWINDLDVAERVLDLARRSAPGTRAETDAQAGVLRSVADTGILLRRAADEAAELTRLLPRPGEPGGDLSSLCDVHGRRGLALARYGDLEAARACLMDCLAVAENELAAREPAEGVAYAARARHNLGELLMEAGRPAEAAQLIERARSARAEGAAPGAGLSPAWRRYTVTAQAAARAAARSGDVVAGLRLAEAVVADRQARLGEPGDINVVAARVSLAETLLEAGQPIEARHLLQEARRHRAELLQPIAYWPNYDTVRLAQVELALREPATVLRLLERSPVLSEWFAAHVSFRLWAEARIAHGLATALAGDAAAARGALAELAGRLEGGPGGEALTAAARRALAEAELMGGDAETAAGLLTRVRECEAVPGDPPGRARTLLLAARCEDARGDDAAAGRHRAALAALAGGGLDPSHPLLLEGRYDEAVRRFETGRFEGLDALLAPLLDRTPLAHGRPALGEGHPLLLKAMVLADRSGAVHLPRVPRQVLWEDA